MRYLLLALTVVLLSQTSFANNTKHYTERSFKNGSLVVEKSTGKVFQVLGNKMYKLELYDGEYLLSNEWQPINKDGYIKWCFSKQHSKWRK